MTTQAIWDAFFVLWVWPSHIGLPLLVGTVLFARPRVERHPAFVNMCVTEIIAGVFMSLLLYTNHADVNGPQPGLALCQFQAALLAGANTMTSFSLLGLVYQVFHSINAASNSKLVHDPVRAKRRTWLFIILPYTVWLVCAFATAVYTNKHPESVQRGAMPYCAAKSGALRIFIAGLDTAVLLGTLALEVLSLLAFVRLWRASGHRDALIDLTMRIIAFALLISVALALAAAALFMPGSPVPDLVMATMGTFILLIFGTQRDILRAWAHTLRMPPRLVPAPPASAPPHQLEFTTFASVTTVRETHTDEDVDASLAMRKLSTADSFMSDVERGMPVVLARSEKDAPLGTPVAWNFDMRRTS